MTQGRFIWNELLTRDVEGAKAFYSAIVGWTYEGTPMAEGGTYWVAHAEGNPAGGIMAMPPGMPDHVPPHWFEYLEVNDVDACLATIVRHGGRILRPPFDVPAVGRLGIATDCTGAAFGLMTPLPKG